MRPYFRYDSLGVTHEGKVRAHNEDSLLVRPEIGLWAVADGMGGHARGGWASAIIVAELETLRLDHDFAISLESISDALYAANDTIHEAAQRAGEPMGSTVAALLIGNARFAALWTGDSRIYRLRRGDLACMTHDHSLVQDLVDRNQLSQLEAKHHPMAHILSHAVGVATPLRLDVVTGEIEDGDIFLLCSDGLTDVVDDAGIAGRLSAAKGAPAAQRLLDLALSRGAPDNVTVVSIACQEIAALPQPGDA
ncbi:MAG TPA: protein phosphatase 2C domain-containing protein [Caulobacteraceae bacterium]|jgi:serine/threonine protein phosphatase PrpC